MKKRTIIAIIVAVCLLFGGGVLLVFGLSFAGNATQMSTLTEREVSIPERFQAVVIDTADCDVTFVPYKSDVDAKILFREADNISHRVVVEDETLKIEMIDDRNWTDHVGIFGLFGRTESMKITVYLPLMTDPSLNGENIYSTVRVTTDTGDIYIPEVSNVSTIQLRTDTGDIRCEGIACSGLDCMTDTGDILIRDSEVPLVKLVSFTGDMDIFGLESAEMELNSTTGEKELEDVSSRILIVQSDTGDVELKWVEAKEYLQVFTDTGDVDIENSDAGSVNIETDTGDVSGNFLTSKCFSANSDTGSVRVPKTREGGECRIESNTGDIRFE